MNLSWDIFSTLLIAFLLTLTFSDFCIKVILLCLYFLISLFRINLLLQNSRKFRAFLNLTNRIFVFMLLRLILCQQLRSFHMVIIYFQIYATQRTDFFFRLLQFVHHLIIGFLHDLFLFTHRFFLQFNGILSQTDLRLFHIHAGNRITLCKHSVLHQTAFWIFMQFVQTVAQMNSVQQVVGISSGINIWNY